jgi:predicted amino acid-binding ACT domain protein
MKDLDEKIDELVKGTASRFEKLEKLILNEVLSYLSERLLVREQRIVFDANNFGIISKIDTLLSRFSTGIQNIGKYIIRGIGSVMGLTTEQLSQIDTRAIKTGKTVTDELLNHAATIINKNLNLERIFLDIKQDAISLLADPKGIDLVELRKALSQKVVGNKLAQKYFSRWTHDLYSQMQRVGANRMRIELGLRFAIYQGGLIATSRDFCEERNRQCFSDEEIMKWKELDWEGKPEIGYNPIIDCGGYNCRHRLDWISDEMAKRLRPDLFGKKAINQIRL